MKTVINISAVTDYSGEPPIVTYSNQVTTVINQPTPTPVITQRIWCSQCDCCSCNCNCCGCCFNCD
ncbi:MAG: hypothetical protein K2K80_02145 [Clostridia bacterium]|nr:hypothetical protein [Clostridia bacterium]